LGRKLLLGVALGATPIVGIQPAGAQEQLIQVQAEISAQERAMFDQAAQSGNAARINAFLRAYPESPLVRSLLMNLPPETLQLVDRNSLSGISSTTIRSLPPTTRRSLGLEGGAPGSGSSNPGSRSTIASEDPYL
jgi:hypothetical protein